MVISGSSASTPLVALWERWAIFAGEWGEIAEPREKAEIQFVGRSWNYKVASSKADMLSLKLMLRDEYVLGHVSKRVPSYMHRANHEPQFKRVVSWWLVSGLCMYG